MGARFIGCDRDQVFLMPPSLRDSVPDGHLVWTVLDAVGELDLPAIYLVGFQNRLLVLISWVFSFVTRGRGARIISSEAPRAEARRDGLGGGRPGSGS
jgi:hypothetical protein